MAVRSSLFLPYLLLLTGTCSCNAGSIRDAITHGRPTGVQTASQAGNIPTGSSNPIATPGSNPDPNQVAPGSSAALLQNFVYSPYKDVTINANWNTGVISTAVTGSPTPLLAAVGDINVVTWAFATGECGSETWGGVVPDALVKANLAAWVAAKKGYIISTGGASGSFTCGSDANWLTFLQRYQSSYFVGVDFDIEAGQSQADIEALVARVKTAQASSAFKNLRFSFTIATLAGSTPQSLGPQGIVVMNALQKASVTHVLINLMTMDYGSSSATNCVLDASGNCQMGQSAIQAAENLHTAYSWPYNQIEITPMLGGNDSPSEVFTLADVNTVVSYVRQKGLAGLHLWSLDRDTDCVQTYASPTCNSYGKAGPMGFNKAILAALK